jgi:hypothetical protein
MNWGQGGEEASLVDMDCPMNGCVFLPMRRQKFSVKSHAGLAAPMDRWSAMQCELGLISEENSCGSRSSRSGPMPDSRRPDKYIGLHRSDKANLRQPSEVTRDLFSPDE